MARDLNNQAKCSQSEDKEIVNEARKLWKATRIGHIKLGLLRYLSQKDAHGYELIRELQARTGGFLSPVAGSVYPILREFELKGYITGTWKTTKEGRKVKVYTLTQRGKKLLETLDELRWEFISRKRRSLEKIVRELNIEFEPLIPSGGGRMRMMGSWWFISLIQDALKEKDPQNRLKLLGEINEMLDRRINQLTSIRKTLERIILDQSRLPNT